MKDVRDATALGRQAIIWSLVWMATKILLSGIALGSTLSLAALPQGFVLGMTVMPPFALTMIRLQALLGLIDIVTLLIAAIVNALWIYRMVTVTHAISDTVSVTPGWAIGWFFVPLLNLVKPFEAIKEAWQVTVNPADWPYVSVPASLRIWWGCWLALGFGGYAGSIAQKYNPGLTGYEMLSWEFVFSGLVAVVLTVTWARIISRISRGQRLLLQAVTFR